MTAPGTTGNAESGLPPVFIRAEAAARLLTFTRREVYDLMAADEIESVKWGRRRLIVPESLYAFRARLIAKQLAERA